MRARSLLLIALLDVCLAGCPGSGGAGDSVEIQLTATPRNAGRIGQATLSSRGERTELSAFVSGVPLGMTQPVRLYAYLYAGSCATHGAQPAYALNSTVLTSRLGPVDGWRLSRSAQVPLATLRATPHALVLRTAPADGGYDIFCGEIH